MNEKKAFYRKIGYFVAILLLLIPLYFLSAPATVKSNGGELAQYRLEHNLSQANLGEIDPGSATMRLATLGLRGVAVNLLWGAVNEYKKKEDWTNMMAALEQLSKLQPNFVVFWKFQAWNVSYNVSVEFDDYRDRYYYVKRGIEFLEKGLEYNRDNPQLLWDLGWFIGQKIGRADEHVEYRRLFKEDDDYHREHGDRPISERDNWLVAEDWYLKAVEAVDEKKKDMGRKSQIVFYDSPAMSRMNYSEAIEEEGTFGAKARSAWRRASEAWKEFGEKPIQHSTGPWLRLGDYSLRLSEAEKIRQELYALVPGLHEELVDAQRANLTPAQIEAIDTPVEDRTVQQYSIALEIEDKVKLTPDKFAAEVAKRDPSQAREAQRLALELAEVETRARYIRQYRQTANYDYWESRSEYEQSENALAARESVYAAKQAAEQAEQVVAQQLFEEGFQSWARVLEEYPELIDDGYTGDLIIEDVEAYRDTLDQLGEQIPDDFPLWELIEENDNERKFTDEVARYRQRKAQAGAQGDAGTDSPDGSSNSADDAADQESESSEESNPEQEDGESDAAETEAGLPPSPE